jgi:hypothetical protein
VLRAQVAQVLQVVRARRDAVGIADHRFDDHAGDLLRRFRRTGCVAPSKSL